MPPSLADAALPHHVMKSGTSAGRPNPVSDSPLHVNELEQSGR